MEKVLENVVAMVKQHQAGIPLKKLAVFYSQTYHNNLTLSSLGFDSMVSLVDFLNGDLVVEGELVFHKTHRHVREVGGAAGASTKATKDGKYMEKVLENIVTMVKQNQAGIPIKQLAEFYNQTYHKNLTLSLLGFNSMASLVASLNRHLVVEGKLVFHRDHRCRVTGAGAGTSAKSTEDSENEILENIVAMMKEYPRGIPLKKVAIVYSQKYRHNLALASLGFKTISCLVASLKEDLVVRGDVVFHKSHQPQNQPGGGTSTKDTEDSRPTTPQRTESLPGDSVVTVPQVDGSPHCVPLTQPSGISLLGSPLISTPSLFSTHCLPVNSLFAASKPAEQLTQQQLYQRVLEVMKKYHLSAPSMDQLQTFYFQQFSEQLPLAQYMSLYDSWEASCPKNLPTQAEPTADPNTAVLPTAAAAKSRTREPEKEEQPPAITSDFLSGSEFPELGANMSSIKQQKSKVKDATHRGGSLPIFTEAYHAQLREVHGANMRAVEAMEEDEEELTGRRRRRVMDEDTVNSLMEDVIREIAAEGELVTKEKVRRHCLNFTGVVQHFGNKLILVQRLEAKETASLALSKDKSLPPPLKRS